MSYSSMSVKEAMQRINNAVNGLFLPAVQRPYVWGSRYQAEQYICKLFDSLMKGYPIGGLIVWNAEEEIPYREFMKDYVEGDIPKIVDKGLFGKPDKWLVYDGQQRLQTLYSCLGCTFNGKVLTYDLCHDMFSTVDTNLTGFRFVNSKDDVKPPIIRMTEIAIQEAGSPSKKVAFRNKVLANCTSLGFEEKTVIETNLEQLWTVFVETDKKSLAYFPVENKKEDEVNEIFHRLNMGGVPLSQADLLMSRIKEHYYDFEERLQMAGKTIYNQTGKGYLFNAYNILQLLHLVVKGTIRIDPQKIKTSEELKQFQTEWELIKEPLRDFFSTFIYDRFKINNNSIIPRSLALLPMIIYCNELHKRGRKLKDLNATEYKKLNEYFILSQINDWNIQTLVDNNSKIIMNSDPNQGFPIDEIKKWILSTRSRNVDLYESGLVDYLWFSLKIMTPTRTYEFDPDTAGRFNPEIDHIFPRKLRGQPDSFARSVDILWNMQPIKGEVNGQKTNKHPLAFFKEIGSKYLPEYDHLPSNDVNDPIWGKPYAFVAKRREIMLDWMKTRYGIEVMKETKLLFTEELLKTCCLPSTGTTPNGSENSGANSYLSKVLQLYDAKADKKWRSRGKNPGYRLVHLVNGLNHYEFLNSGSKLGVEFHIENDSGLVLAEPLAEMLEKLKPHFPEATVVWDPKWSKNRGRLRILYNKESTEPSIVAEAMHKFISITSDSLIQKLNKS